MASPADRAYVSESGTISMLALPGLFVQADVGKPTRAEWEAGRHCFDHPVLGDRYVMLCRISPRTGRDIPDDEYRRAVSAGAEAKRGRLVAVGYVVIVNSGMLGATTRAVIAGISMLRRHSHEERVFGAVNDAAQWLHEKLPQGQTPQAMVAAHDELMTLQSKAR